jgi:rubrerythrin
MAIITEDEIIDIAIRLEEKGEAFYTTAAAYAADYELQELFGQLSTQESEHLRAFQQMGRSAVRMAFTPDEWEEFQAYVGALLQQSFFAGPDTALDRAASARDQASVIRAALGFEKESILFYEKLQTAVHETSRHIVARIIHEEERHVRGLADALDALSAS